MSIMWRIVLIFAVVWALASLAGFVGTLYWLDQKHDLEASNVLSAAQVFSQVTGGGIAVAGLVAVVRELQPRSSVLKLWTAPTCESRTYWVYLRNTGNAPALNVRVEIDNSESLEWGEAWTSLGSNRAIRHGQLHPGRTIEIARAKLVGTTYVVLAHSEDGSLTRLEAPVTV